MRCRDVVALGWQIRGTVGLSAWRRGRGGIVAGVYQVFEFLAGLEERNFLGRHLDAVAGLGVAPDAGFALARTEAAKAADLDLIAGAQRAHDAVEDGLDDDFAVIAGQFR